jgi:large subunit ribosomal protein L24e
MGKCDYCGITFEKGTGKMYIKDSGKILNFCSHKCEMDMIVYKRKARDYKWTEVSKKEKASKHAEIAAEKTAEIKNAQ